MFHYDKEQNLLTFYKVENPDMGERFNLLKDIQESYQHFLDYSLFDVLEVINECLRDDHSISKRLEFSAKKVSGYGRDEDHIRVYAKIQGDRNATQIPVVNLPYMDNLGKLHFFDRTVKSLVNKIASADDMSYDVNKNVLSLVLKKKTIKIDCSSKTFDIKVYGRRQKTIKLPYLILCLAHIEGEHKDVHGMIRNPLLQAPLSTVDREMAPNTAKGSLPYRMLYENDITSGSGLLDSLVNDPDYSIESVRDSLNTAVALDRALGEVLSRPVLSYPAGTYITPAVLQDIKRNKINCIYIRTLVPNPTKKISGGLADEDWYLQYTKLEKGWEVGDYLRERVPKLRDYDVVPEDMMLPEGDWSFSGKPATAEILEFIRDTGKMGVRLGDKRIPYPFETEVLGNYTLRYGDLFSLTECEARGVSPQDWFCYKDNPDSKADYKRGKLSSDDLIAIYSAVGFMMLRGINLFMDRDKDFLKKVELADIAMQKALTKAIKDHMRVYGNNIVSYMNGNGNEQRAGVDIFGRLSSTLKSVLGDNGVIESCDMTNYIAEISQATHVTNKVKEAPEVMRQIATPYYGRICPFETPEGKQLGLVNNKAIGCHIVDGNMLVPVRKVLHEGNLLRISDNITEISVKQEIKLRITDVLQLKPANKEGYYEDTRVIAKVPNPDPNGERLIFADIYASDLDYVYAHTEQFISATTSLIPFAAANDAVRDSFGSKMIKSAIYLLNPDVPCVQTFMYRSIFDSSEAYLVRAKRSGTVVDVSMNMLTVMYDGDNDETNYRLDEFKVTKDSVVFIRYKVKQGDRFRAGQLLADCSASKEGVYCPGKDELVGYMSTGYNYEDAVQTCERATIDYISIGSTTITRRRAKNSTIDNSGMFKYYKRGDVLAKVTVKTEKGNEYTEELTANHGAGIWYSSKEVLENGQMSYKLDLMGYNRLQCGDKTSGRHGNKGVIAKVSKNSEMPMLANGMPLRMLHNPEGLPSRMNIGQILETHGGLIATVLGVNINSDSYNGASTEEVKAFMRLAHELANAPSPDACAGICAKYNIEPDMVEKLQSNMSNIMEWAGVFDEYGDARVWNPVTGKWFPFPVTIGVSHILKMKQEAETKIHVRAGLLEETYQLTSGQPTRGGKQGGGQGMGEMEVWAVAAYGASALLYEMCNTKSDNETARVNSELQAIHSPLRVPEKYSTPRSVTNFMYLLESFGLVLEDDTDSLPDVSYNTSVERYIYDVKKLITEKEEASMYTKREDGELRGSKLADTLLSAIFK